MKFGFGKAALALVAGGALVLSGCAGGPGKAGGGSGQSLVVDSSFDLKTADPNREFETTGGIVSHAMYETLLTFRGDDVTKPVDGLASYRMNDTATEMTLTWKGGSKFSDGSPVTVDDAVFSLKRLQGIKGNPSFLLDGVTVEKVDDKTIKLTTAEPKPELPFILPNPALGVVNKKAVEKHGGSADAGDKAEAFLNKTSAGSGPYQLESFDAARQVVFTANPHYAGKKPRYQRIVLRNVAGPTQKLNVEKGESQVALDLNPDQVAELAGKNVTIKSNPSRYVIFALLNQNPELSNITATPEFVKAFKLAVDYDKLRKLTGKGSTQPGGVVPDLFDGALPAKEGLKHDLETAKAALAKSGYEGQTIELNYPNDITVQGVSLDSLAQAIQEQVGKIGIKIQLKPAPVATELDAYRNGKEQIGLWYWGPDFPDPSNYAVFSPGELVGLRAGWEAGADQNITDLVKAARTAPAEKRAEAYRAWQRASNETGPFVPLVQPAQNVVFSKNVKSVTTNAVWTVDFALID